MHETLIWRIMDETRGLLTVVDHTHSIVVCGKYTTQNVSTTTITGPSMGTSTETLPHTVFYLDEPLEKGPVPMNRKAR